MGAKVRRVEARRPDLRFPLPERFAARVEGQTIVRLERRAKYLVAVLSGGEALVMHLGMTGRFTIEQGVSSALLGEYIYPTGADPKHDHVVLHLSGGVRVVYNDPRRFGFMVMMANAERAEHPLFNNLGAEPLSDALTPEYLAARAAGRKVNLKAVPDGPAQHRGPWQHLCVGGAASRGAFARPGRALFVRQARPADGPRTGAGAGHHKCARSSDCSGWINAEGLSPR